jgi:threonine/homoserine/homoserine lactone efflux protein
LTLPTLSIFLKGLLLGLAIAAPVGPIGVLCIHRTLQNGRAAGFLSGLGAATADAFYGAVAAFGLTAVTGFLTRQQTGLSLVGGLFLLYLGAKSWFRPPANPDLEEAALSAGYGSYFSYYSSTVFLTLTNPATILSFAIIFAGVGVSNSQEAGWRPAALLVWGVFVGSALWWFLLSGGVSLLRGRLTPNLLRWVNRAAGLIIGGFGAVLLFNLLRTVLTD